MCDGAELAKQKRLLIQRFFVASIISTQTTKRIDPEDVLFLSIFACIFERLFQWWNTA